MNDTPTTPFAPFTPPTQPLPMFDDTPHGRDPMPPAPVKRKRGRPAVAKPAKAPNVVPEKVPTKRRKPRSDKQALAGTAAKKPPKFDLQTILRVAATLKEADQRMFERLLGELSAMPKAARARILAALHGVFG